jgi:hypothetical protein
MAPDDGTDVKSELSLSPFSPLYILTFSARNKSAFQKKLMMTRDLQSPILTRWISEEHCPATSYHLKPSPWNRYTFSGGLAR